MTDIRRELSPADILPIEGKRGELTPRQRFIYRVWSWVFLNLSLCFSFQGRKLSAHAQMASGAAPWRQLFLDALEAHKHLPHSNFFQLATVRPNGAPAVRTVVYRGFAEENSSKLMITTDSRSRKVEDIKHCALGEIVVYLTDSWEQFRLQGHLELIGPESPAEEQVIRRKMWDSSSGKALVDFAGPPPGHPLAAGESKPPHFDRAGGPLDTFLIVTLDPIHVDYYNSKKKKRVLFEKSSKLYWTEQAVNP